MPAVPNRGKPLILLTGVSGFCGAWIAHALLQDGYAVCGVVRSETKGEYLASVFSSHGSSFFFEKIEDTAKAAVVDYDDNTQNVLETNAEGIDHILESVKKHGSKVQRFIYLGSVQALLEKDKPLGYIYKETDWYQSAIDAVKANKPDITGEQRYAASKALAEQNIIRFEEQNPNLSWDITRILPSYVFGFANPTELNYSMKMVYLWLTNPPSPEVLPYQMGYNFWAADYIDVQDLAKLSVKGLQTEGAGGKRIIVNAKAFSYQDLFNTVASLGLKGPRGTPELALQLLPEKFVDDHTAKDILGWSEYIPLASCIKDCYESFEQSGLRISE
ncbi:D-lactaldehyde dehydrogenase [Boletus edulis BED1]|uniref:D-lactaldehyde dehydrogenase n=1 Tax=Boletus edulis BED1 TaxID=1328754 RepID=A0AAD4BP02_BOLED|nr:D-lactaldehyde dehydrogenase [Boletus edulis BED1]